MKCLQTKFNLKNTNFQEFLCILPNFWAKFGNMVIEKYANCWFKRAFLSGLTMKNRKPLPLTLISTPKILGYYPTIHYIDVVSFLKRKFIKKKLLQGFIVNA